MTKNSNSLHDLPTPVLKASSFSIAPLPCLRRYLSSESSCLWEGPPRSQIRGVHYEFSPLMANQTAVVQTYEDLYLDSKVAPLPHCVLCVHDPLQAMISLTLCSAQAKKTSRDRVFFPYQRRLSWGYHFGGKPRFQCYCSVVEANTLNLEICRRVLGDIGGCY
jgi:hypothetical protein